MTLKAKTKVICIKMAWTNLSLFSGHFGNCRTYLKILPGQIWIFGHIWAYFLDILEIAGHIWKFGLDKSEFSDIIEPIFWTFLILDITGRKDIFSRHSSTLTRPRVHLWPATATCSSKTAALIKWLSSSNPQNTTCFLWWSCFQLLRSKTLEQSSTWHSPVILTCYL